MLRGCSPVQMDLIILVYRLSNGYKYRSCLEKNAGRLVYKRASVSRKGPSYRDLD